MRHVCVMLLTAGVIIAGAAAPAQASPHHRHHYHHRHGHGHVGILLHSGPVYRPVYARPYVPYYYDYSAPSYAYPAYPAPAARPVPPPAPTDFAGDDRYCREYQTSTRIGGRSQSSYGTACMQPDGSWEVMN